MATVQEIEDAIRKLAAKNPKDPNIGVLAKARQNMLAGGGGGADKPFIERAEDYIEGTVKNFADPAQWSKAMDNPVITSLQNPQQSIPDALRTTSDFVTLGANDRLRAGLKGTDYEVEKAATEAADTRLGTLDEALNVGAAVAMPSLAARGMPAGAGALTKAGLYGGEGAALAGSEASIKGEDVLPAMAYGGFGGAAGSVGADVLGSVANAFNRNKPQFRTDEDLFRAADTTPRNTRAGKDIASRADLTERVRLAQTKGQQGFKDMLSGIEGYGRKASGVSREMTEDISRAANQPNKSKQAWETAGDVVQGGTGWGRLPVAMATGGTLPALGAWMKGRAGKMSEVDPAIVERIKAKLRQGGGAGDALTPEEIDVLRNAVAKAGMGAGRTGPQ